MVKISKFSQGRCPLTPAGAVPLDPSIGVCYRLFYLLRLVTLGVRCCSEVMLLPSDALKINQEAKKNTELLHDMHLN